QIFEVRECLELKAVSGYTEPAPKAFVKKLKTIVADHEQAITDKDVANMFYLNDLLHETIYAKSGNKFLLAAIRHHSLLSHLIHTNSMQSADLRELGVEDHWTMVGAIEKGDQKLLAATLRSHIRRFRTYYLENLAA